MIDFAANRKWFLSFSAVVLAFAAIASMILGIKWDIRFQGGLIASYRYQGELEEEDFRQTVQSVLGKSVTVQPWTEEETGAAGYLLSASQCREFSSQEELKLTATLNATFPQNEIEFVFQDIVQPLVSQQFWSNIQVGLGVLMVLVFFYFSAAFQKIGGWLTGILTIGVLVHDLLLVFFVFAIFRIPVGEGFLVAALLTLGCSLINQICVYNKIRENRQILGEGISCEQLANQSIHQLLPRILSTLAVEVMASTILCVMAFLSHMDSLVNIVFPIIAGIFFSAYSSICLGGPLWAGWYDFRAKKRGQ